MGCEEWLNIRVLSCNLYVETFPKLPTLEDLGMISVTEQASFLKRPTSNISMATWNKHDFLFCVRIKERQLQYKPKRESKRERVVGGRERKEIENEREMRENKKGIVNERGNKKERG